MNYWPVIQTGIGLLLIIAAGYIITKLKLISAYTIDATNRFLLKLCYPPMIFRAVAKQKFADIDFHPMLIGGMIIVATYTFCLIIFCLRSDKSFFYYCSSTLPSIYTNYLIIGIPFFEVIWGDNVSMVTILNLTNDIVTVPIYLIIANIFRIRENNKKHAENNDGITEKFSFKILFTIVKNIVLNPIMFGNIISFIWAGFGWKFPDFIQAVADIAANGVLASCLLCVGGFLSQNAIIACPWPQFIFCIFVRHFMMSLFAAVFSYAFKIDHLLARQCTIMAALPSATASFLLAHQNGTGPGCSSTLIFFSTILCVPAMIGWLSALDALKIFV